LEIRKLNTLRGLAALIVFITHFSDETNWLGGILGGAAGQYGVMLFFLLSGFLMSHLYFEQDFNKQNIQKYFLARLARVLPLYLLIVLCSYCLSLWDIQALYDITTTKELISHLTFIYGDSVLWTISPEIQFYLIFPLFWYLAVNRVGYIYVLIIAVLIILFLTNFPRLSGDLHGVKYNIFNVLRSLPYFFIGLIMGMHYKGFKVPQYLNKNWFVLTLLLIPLMYPEFTPVTTDANKRMWLSYEVLLVMSSVFFAIVFLVPNNNILLANSVGDFFGKISYSLYLLHLPIIVQVNNLNISIEFKLLTSTILSIAIAYLSYMYLEKPTAKYIRSKIFKKTVN
jgi:peptidoglycan/LPS O-acetylase OafA/YrhL